MELVFGYLAGLLTLINPCVLPVLPIVLGTALNVNRFGPIALAAGMSTSFVALGLFVNFVGIGIGIDDQTIAQVGAVLMVAFGIVLVVPQFSARFATATAGIAAGADSRIDTFDSGSLSGQFLGGALLGTVWSPCVGPTLGAAIGLASQGQSFGWVTAIMISFAAGVSTMIIALSYGARKYLPQLRAFAQNSRPILGGIFILIGLVIFFRIHHVIEAWALGLMPTWWINLSVRF